MASPVVLWIRCVGHAAAVFAMLQSAAFASEAPAKAPAGHETVPAAQAKPAASAASKAENPSEEPAAKRRRPIAAALGSSAASAPPDPMDIVRERLAAKLGQATTEPNGARTLRITSRPASATETAAKPVAHVESVRRKTRVSEDKGSHGGTGAPLPAMPMAHAAHWAYEGAGSPEHWGEMKAEFNKCASGSRQSPIDIRDGIKVQLDPVQFDYKTSAFNVVDNGHTIQVNVGPGNSIDVMGRRYDLVQFHFHRPSEARIDGRQFDMELHLVHKDIDGRLAVVGVLLDRGSAHPVVQNVWNNLPLEKGDTVKARTTIDLESLLPQDRRYFTYMGSLTTPPCTEGVLWMVMKTPMPISGDQLAIFSRLYPNNARPVQSVAGRLIKESQ